MLPPLFSVRTADLIFNSLNGALGIIELLCEAVSTNDISAVVLLRLVFSLQCHDSVSRRGAMLIYGNRFHLVLLDNHNELWLVFHF